MGPLSCYWPEINQGLIEDREDASNPFPFFSQDCVVEPFDEYGLSDSALDSELVRFKNEDGFVRRDLVRDNLRLSDDCSLEILATAYAEWLLDDLGIVLKKTQETWSSEGDWMTRVSYQFTKARKRGNDLDAFRIDRRMRTVRDNVIPYCQSSDLRKPLKNTRALYVTLTVDPRLTDGDLETAWRNIGRQFNDFKSRLSRVFETVIAEVKNGEFVETHRSCKIQVLRSWEAHKSGQPHVHAILCFEDFCFGIFQDARFRWRAKLKDRIQDAWPYGFVDVRALTPGTLEKELTNVLWYVSKNLSSMDYRLVRSWPKKRRLTQSILWYLGARSFSISRGLTKPSGDDLIKRTSITQNRLDGDGFDIELISWEFLGLIHRKDTELHRDDWEIEYSEPPPWLGRCWKPYSGRNGSDLFSSWLSGGL